METFEGRDKKSEAAGGIYMAAEIGGSVYESLQTGDRNEAVKG